MPFQRSEIIGLSYVAVVVLIPLHPNMRNTIADFTMNRFLLPALVHECIQPFGNFRILALYNFVARVLSRYRNMLERLIFFLLRERTR